MIGHRHGRVITIAEVARRPIRLVPKTKRIAEPAREGWGGLTSPHVHLDGGTTI